ncbi:MAG: ABC transporter substrate-binding protein [Acidimicrobiia bacterium]
MMRTRRSRLRAAPVAIVLAAALAACSSGGSSSSTTTRDATVTIPPDAPVARSTPTRLDERLVIGALLPRSGPGATLGEPLIAGVDLAVSEINAAGGVMGRPVRQHTTDEGSSASSAHRSLEVLLDSDVDVIVGPASSRVALGLLSEMLDPGLAVCSPTNTAISLRRFPDDENRYFRTIPSDALQATAMARVIERTGRNAVSIVYIDDEFGLDYATALVRELDARGIGVLTNTAYDPAEEDLGPIGIRAVASGAAAIAVIGDATDGGRMLSTLRQLDTSDSVEYFVNDALRLPNLAASIGAASPAFLERLRGVAPSAESTSQAFNGAFAERFPDTPTEYAAYAYDCTILLALAATAAGSDDPDQIARFMASVSRSGSPCTTFAECSQLLGEGRNVDYVGASGSVELDDQGDVQGGTFKVFRFEPSGMDVSAGDVNV